MALPPHCLLPTFIYIRLDKVKLLQRNPAVETGNNDEKRRQDFVAGGQSGLVGTALSIFDKELLYQCHHQKKIRTGFRKFAQVDFEKDRIHFS
jgi:hypothetical protein